MTTADPDKSDMRLREAHHRIANNLALIAGFVRLQSSAVAKDRVPLSPTAVCMLLEEVGVRIETVGRLHHLLGGRTDAGLVDLGDYLAATCGILAQSVCRHRDVELNCDAGSCTIEPEKAGLMGLIVAELVTNAVKYAHPAGAPGRIDVACHRSQGSELVLTVADDGVGLPDGFNPKVDGGLGMRVVRSLATQLEADLDFRSSPLGLTVCVTAASGNSSRNPPTLAAVN